jgi:hypothetical protein
MPELESPLPIAKTEGNWKLKKKGRKRKSKQRTASEGTFSVKSGTVLQLLSTNSGCVREGRAT